MWLTSLVAPLVPLAGLASVVAAQLAPAAAPPASAAAAAAPVTINSIVSTWWNWTDYLEHQRNLSLTFKPGSAPTKSVNSTKTAGVKLGVVVRENRRLQQMKGLGMGITDAASIVLADLKTSRPDAYHEVLNLLFNPADEWIERGGLGANMVRVPMGACDFGYQQYTYDDTVDGSPDPNLTQFNMDKAPKMWATLADIKALQPRLKVFPAPWSPPAWVKGQFNGSLIGGSVLEKYEDAYTQYFLKSVQGFDRRGLRPYILSLQNEPKIAVPTYPGTIMETDQQARLGKKVRKALDDNGFKDVKLGAFDFNWDRGSYPIEVFDMAKESFGAVLWHCYGTGLPINQTLFSNAYPGVETHMTECTRTTTEFNEPWVNIGKQMERLVFGSVRYGSQSIVLWNGALLTNIDGFTQPHLPDTCMHCLAPVLIWPNSSTTGELPQGDGTGLATRSMRMRTARRGLDGGTAAAQPLNARGQAVFSATSPPPATASSAQGALPWAGEATEAEKQAEAQQLQLDDAQYFGSAAGGGGHPSQSSNGISSPQAGKSISPNRDYYKLTSDFVTLHHFGRAIRPVRAGGDYATLATTTTTEDDTLYPRVFAQTYALDKANAQNQTRFTMILFQRNDHLGTGLFEDATISIEFRNQTADLTLPPGLYTLEWYADP